METWPAEFVFLITGLLAGLASAAAEARQHKRVTLWNAMTASVYGGCAGAALGMFAYQWLGGKEHPEMIIGAGMMVGLRYIAPNVIFEIVRRILNVNGKPEKDDDANRN